MLEHPGVFLFDVGTDGQPLALISIAQENAQRVVTLAYFIKRFGRMNLGYPKVARAMGQLQRSARASMKASASRSRSL